jgi:mono/diheme cytochrome c family protein
MLKFPAIRKSRLMAAVAMGAGLVLSACQSLEQIAPPVAAVAARPSGNLELGRDLYLTKCTKCHAPEPILKYSASEWETIAADMAVETNLNAHETAAVRDYVMAVLASAEKSRPLDERRGM